MDKPVPLILISACLAGEAVRYDGTDLLLDDPLLAALRDAGRLVVICPEVAGGLAVPRPPAEIVGDGGEAVLDGRARVVGRGGADMTAAFVAGARETLRLAQEHTVAAAVLTERSPSCGSSLIYSGDFSGVRRPGSGVTAALLRRHGIAVFNQHQLSAAFEAAGRA
ncbi:MAG: DUF523 domain-containing protein [Pseudomonadota bacterium]